MTAYVALLRAVNVGGTGKLPMRDLVDLCEAAGFGQVKTYIASGNVVFTSEAPRERVQALLEERLLAYAGRPVGIYLRTSPELAALLAGNPFTDRRPDRTVAIFLDAPPPADTLDTVSGLDGEEIALGLRELYVHYGEGMGRSRLKIPAAKAGTARNINTVTRLAAMVAAIS